MSSPIDWRQVAESVASSGALTTWPREVEVALAGLSADEPIGIACSGGADSVALVLSAWAHFSKASSRLRIYHFNHGWRGAESDADEQFVADLASGLGLPFRSERATDEEALVRTEAAARSARLRFYSRVMSADGARALLLGHTRTDVAETLLMRLSRGSGCSGLAAPRPVQRWRDGRLFLRPLLDCDRERLRSDLQAARGIWRDDTSNDSEAFYRNRVRNDVLASWAAAAPADLWTGLALSRARLAEEDQALEAWLDELMPPEARESDELDLTLLTGRPPALFRRALVRWLGDHVEDDMPERSAVDAWLADIVAGEPFRASWGDRRYVVYERGRVWIEQEVNEPANWPAAGFPIGGCLFLPDGGRLESAVLDVDESRLQEIISGRFSPETTVFLNLDLKPSEGLIVRLWRPGDRYQPLGAPGKIKLQDQFTNRKISRCQRLKLPVVCLADGSPLWVPGLPPSERGKLNILTKKCVQLTYWGKTPRY